MREGMPSSASGTLDLVGFRRLLGVLLVLFCMSGCTKSQREAIRLATQPAPVDLRAVPAGVEVGLVCGAAAPTYVDLDRVDARNHELDNVSHDQYTAKTPVRTVTVRVPPALRKSRFAVTVAIIPPPPSVFLGLYAATFQYADLPTGASKRIPGHCYRGNVNGR